MELKKTYNVNIINKDKSSSCFIIVEQFNSDATQYFQNYYKQLLYFNKNNKWFGKFEYPHVEIGNVSNFRNLKSNSWLYLLFVENFKLFLGCYGTS
jgi:hypothetical protein